MVLLAGTLGFMLLGVSFSNSLYEATIILLTHYNSGVGEPLGEKLLTIFLVIGNFFILAYIIKFVADYFLGGGYMEERRTKKMLDKADKMKDHYIVCGFGRVGKQVCDDLKHAGVRFLILDRDMKEIRQAQELGYITINEDPTVEEHLKKASVAHAKALISCLGQDTDNLFVTLTARSMNPDLYIVARANNEENTSKFEKAGANRVAIPYQIGGYHMATMALRPAVLDFLDVIVDSRHKELEVEEIEIPVNSMLSGKRICDELSRDKTGVTILAVNRKDGSSKINPNGSEEIRAEDKLIIMGNREQLSKVTALVK
jgi:voltage-gated potassium channel